MVSEAFALTSAASTERLKRAPAFRAHMRWSASFIFLVAFLPLAHAQGTSGPVPVDAQVYIINVGNYDATKGTYVADFYLTLSWNATAAPANFTPARYEFMNGRASATDKVSDVTDENGIRTLNYRIQANLYSQPKFDHYPYDTQTVEVTFEDAVHNDSELRYVPDLGGSGLDEQAKVAGFRVQNVNFSEVTKAYPPAEHFSRARFVVTVDREPLSSTIKSFLPPFAFMLVAGLGFFFHPSKVANRLALGTGMLISAVAFHISQTQSLPPNGSLILFDKVMMAVYVFLVCALVVATLIHIDEDYWKDVDYTKKINVYGILGTVGATVLTYVLLVAL